MTDNQTEHQDQTVFKGESEEGNEGTQNAPQAESKKSSTGMEENVAGLLCYLAGIITGIIFLVIEKENRFVRFHAMQSSITFGALFVLSIVLSFIPIIGWLIGLLITPLGFILWIVLMIKAYQGKWFKLPIVGNMSEKQLDKMEG
ncbi:DUF4870 domain-containing protein [Lentibacillus saliphilus]|uniref:DUF4870 domain-containing protein n=1 Tax=Lentibacillus saliphilus TaxID=2737028 RepID=UPI001C30886A|nr:DUF4870 domain-containing protein [Lentibacillus saliphilus]